MEDYAGDYNIRKLAYIGINAMNYLYARRMLHNIASGIDCSDPIEAIFNADKLAAAIAYNESAGGRLNTRNNDEDLDNDSVDLLLSSI